MIYDRIEVYYWPMAITIFWIIFATVVPFLIPVWAFKKSLSWLFCIMTAVLGWMLWFSCFVFQMNPFIGPKMHYTAVYMIAREWNNNPIPKL